MKFSGLLLIFLICLTFYGCVTTAQTNNSNGINNQTVVDSNKIVANSNSQTKETDSKTSAIRSIDFENFTYNWFPKYGDFIIKKKIILHDGANQPVHVEGPQIRPNGEDYKEYLADVSYADLTGDGVEEAIVTVGVEFYRWNPQCIFIFGVVKNKVSALWKYETDIVDSNLAWRGHKVRDESLVIDEYDTKFGDPGTCCPYRYFRKTFKWNGKTFVNQKTETIANETQHKDYTGYPSEDK